MEHIFTLFTLVLLQAVLGFDNLLYISLESKRAPEASRQKVRRLGIGLAIVLRIVLLFVVIQMVKQLDQPLFSFGDPEVYEQAHAEAHSSPTAEAHSPEVTGEQGVEAAEKKQAFTMEFFGSFKFDSLIFLLGGLFILYTAIKEIWHLIGAEIHGHGEREPTAPWKVITMIVIMNLVFSFDSILSAMALSDTFWVLATAIIIGGILMIVLADKISVFIEKNRMYEVLGLFILFLVGILLISEGAHKAHLVLFGHPIDAMSKATFYFVLAALVLVDIVQGKYQKKLIAKQRAATIKAQINDA